MCESAIVKLRHLFHLVGLKTYKFQFILTNYGLFEETLHVKIGALGCFKKYLSWYWSCSVWALNAHCDTDPSPVFAHSPLNSWLYEMLDLVSPFGHNHLPGLLTGRLNRSKVWVWCGLWLLLTGRAFYFSHQRTEGFMKDTSEVENKSLKLAECVHRGWRWNSFDGLCGGNSKNGQWQEAIQNRLFLEQHIDRRDIKDCGDHTKDAAGYMLLLSCSSLYCLLWDLQHVYAALQLSQRQGGFNTLWLQLKIFYQLLKWQDRWENMLSKREMKRVKKNKVK